MKISLLSPGGNTTALIWNKPFTDRKKINDLILKMFPAVEQVGYLNFEIEKNVLNLEMSGGEFCGNALRSAAYLVLRGRKGEVKAKVSGTWQLLKTGVREKMSAFAQIPIKKALNSVEYLSQKISAVKLDGIAFLVVQENPTGDKEKIIAYSQKLISQFKFLNEFPASGVVFYGPLSKDEFSIKPIVWVRSINTFFYETACASGSTAMALLIAKNYPGKKLIVKVNQPSGSQYKITVNSNKKEFINAELEGPVKIIKEQNINLPEFYQ